MKKFITVAALSVGVSAFAATKVAPQLDLAKAEKVDKKVEVLQRGAEATTVGLVVTVGLSNGCRNFAGFWFQDNQKTDDVAVAPPSRQLHFATSTVVHPSRPCTEIYRMLPVTVPIRLIRGDEESSAQTLFSIKGLGNYSVAYNWKSNEATVSEVLTLK